MLNVQGETRAAQLQQQVARQHTEMARLQADLSDAQASGKQMSSRVSALEKQLQEKSAALVNAMRLCLAYQQDLLQARAWLSTLQSLH